MIASTLLATMMITSLAANGANDAAQDYVRASANGQFLSDYYPEGALKRGEQGRVAFKLTIERDGWIGACEVTESSGFPALDRETCEIMVQYAKVKPARRADGKAVRAVQDGHIIWKLPANVAKAAVAAAEVVEKPEPILCRRDPAPGSMVKKVIQCLTNSEWELQHQNTRDELERLQGKGGASSGG